MTNIPLRILAVLYLALTVWLSLYGLHSWVLLLLYWLRRSPPSPPTPPGEWPAVTVQLPIYNERHVVERLIDAAAHLDYPRDRLQIQVLDDSTDETTALARRRAALYQAQGIDIQVLRRPSRDGFKGGALTWGLKRARGEFIAIFDADFVPRHDFLRRTLPHFFQDRRLGMIQTRWSHLNAGYSLLTRVQALALDGHFVVEQTARSRAGLLMHFNGTAGVWRHECIEASGGWQTDTLCEDLDLSYRAQLAGFRCLYLPDVEEPAELPPQILAFKRQQYRWAQGSFQCLRKLASPILHSRRLTPVQKLMGLIHLSGYTAHPLILLLLFITLPLLLHSSMTGQTLGALGWVCLGPLLIYITGQWAIYPDWRRRLLSLPLLILVGTGIAWNNTLAAWEGLTRWGGSFDRTPKFQLEGRQGRWNTSRYRLSRDRSVVGEVVLTIYALTAAGTAWATGNGRVIPFLLVYAAAFGLVAGLSLAEITGLLPRSPAVRKEAGGKKQEARDRRQETRDKEEARKKHIGGECVI